MTTSDSLSKETTFTGDTCGITVTEALEMALDELGWHGAGDDDDQIFYCEFCKASHEDCTLIPHRKGCKVTVLRNVLARARGEDRSHEGK